MFVKSTINSNVLSYNNIIMMNSYNNQIFQRKEGGEGREGRTGGGREGKEGARGKKDRRRERGNGEGKCDRPTRLFVKLFYSYIHTNSLYS